MVRKRDPAWHTLPAGPDLDSQIAFRAGWQLMRQPCAGGRACKTHMFVLYDPNGQWVNDTFVHVNETDEEAIQLLWQNTPETHFSTDLKAAWSLLIQSGMIDVCLSTDVIKEDGQEHYVAQVVLAECGKDPQGADDHFYEGQSQLNQPALALVWAWLAWHDARSACEPIPA